MTKFPDALWLNVSPALQKFDLPLLKILSKFRCMGQWEYCQDLDEALSLETALTLLHDYLKTCDRPLHLLGHSTGGLLGLIYADRYPERVQSLTLLSVGVHPAVDWQAHYYAQRRLLPCSQDTLLRQMVYTLFGCTPKDVSAVLVKLLKQDLLRSLSPHHLWQSQHISSMGVNVPTLVCGSVDDMIIDPQQLQGWKPYLNPLNSQLWICPGGRYFFHYFYAPEVSEQIIDFWNLQSPGDQSLADPAFMKITA